MINEYVDNVELKRLFEDKLLTPESTRYFYKKRGILMPSQKPEDIATQAYTIFLGTSDLQELQDMMNAEASYIQSAIFEIEYKSATPEALVGDLIDDINVSKRWSDSRLTVIGPNQDNENEISFSLQYEKVNRGSNSFQSRESKKIDVIMRKVEGQRLLIDVRQSASSETSKVVKYLSDLSRAECVLPDDPEKFSFDYLNLSALTTKHRVEFFDRFAAVKFKDWHLKTINGISIKRTKDSSDDEDDGLDENNEQVLSEDSSDLAGINQAILHGQALRSNKFVNSCIQQGFHIASMKYHYIMKNDATQFIIAVSGKKNMIHVDVIRSYRDDEDKLISCPYSKEEQDGIVREIQSEVRRIYADLFQEQKANEDLNH